MSAEFFNLMMDNGFDDVALSYADRHGLCIFETRGSAGAVNTSVKVCLNKLNVELPEFCTDHYIALNPFDKREFKKIWVIMDYETKNPDNYVIAREYYRKNKKIVDRLLAAVYTRSDLPEGNPAKYEWLNYIKETVFDTANTKT